MKSIDRLRDILAEREEGYGGSEETLDNIASLWSAYLTMRAGGEIEIELGGDSVAEMMVLLKIARSAGKVTESSQDDRLDQAGYALLGADIIDRHNSDQEESVNAVPFGFQVEL